MNDLVARALSRGAEAAAGRDWVDLEFQKCRPILYAFMTDTEGVQGASREPASLLVFRDGGSFKGCLIEKQAHLRLFAEGPTLESMLDCMEARLQADPVDWRAEKQQPYKPKRA